MLKKVLKNHGQNIVHIRIVTKTKKSQRTKLTRKRRTKMRKNKKTSQEIENEAKIKQ
jgi:primase-polymerase (primpol)-like protein